MNSNTFERPQFHSIPTTCFQCTECILDFAPTLYFMCEDVGRVKFVNRKVEVIADPSFPTCPVILCSQGTLYVFTVFAFQVVTASQHGNCAFDQLEHASICKLYPSIHLSGFSQISTCDEVWRNLVASIWLQYF